MYFVQTSYSLSIFNLVAMRKLLDFLVRKRHWFLFILLEIISVVLIYRNNAYQRSIIFSSGNIVTGHIASISGAVMSYLELKQINRELFERNSRLEIELLRLQEQMAIMKADTVHFAGYAADSVESFHYDMVTAQVVNNSLVGISNYITINKGAKDGIAINRGVVSQNGVVGQVCIVSNDFSVVLPLLNPKSRLSCKVLGSNNFGSLVWDGRDSEYANLEDLPRHVNFKKGDTIVTNGYSSIFPAGVIVGTIADFRKQHDDNFYSLKVKLATDFTALTDVRVITNYLQNEQQDIEKEARKND